MREREDHASCPLGSQMCSRFPYIMMTAQRQRRDGTGSLERFGQPGLQDGRKEKKLTEELPAV